MREQRAIELGDFAIGPEVIAGLLERFEDADGFTLDVETKDGTVYHDASAHLPTGQSLVFHLIGDDNGPRYTIPFAQITKLTIQEF